MLPLAQEIGCNQTLSPCGWGLGTRLDLWWVGNVAGAQILLHLISLQLASLTEVQKVRTKLHLLLYMYYCKELSIYLHGSLGMEVPFIDGKNAKCY